MVCPIIFLNRVLSHLGSHKHLDNRGVRFAPDNSSARAWSTGLL